MAKRETEQTGGFGKVRRARLLWEMISDGINETMDKGNAVDIIYGDCPKAFDKIPHEMLLRNLGITGRDAKCCRGAGQSEVPQIGQAMPLSGGRSGKPCSLPSSPLPERVCLPEMVCLSLLPVLLYEPGQQGGEQLHPAVAHTSLRLDKLNMTPRRTVSAPGLAPRTHNP